MTFRIKSVQKLVPFSHSAGKGFLLPLTQSTVQVFPTCLKISEKGREKEMHWPITGPVQQFTVELNLEKEIAVVFGQAQEGFFRYLLFAEKGKILIYLEKGPLPFPLKQNQVLYNLESFYETDSLEKLSLGMHKKQEWEQLERRGDLKELFPLWLRIGSLTSSETVPSKNEGNYLLLERCRELIEKKEKIQIVPAFVSFFRAAFSDIFLPQKSDPLFLGLSSPTKKELSPFPLLTESSRMIRGLFFQEENENWSLLPCLPPEFHSGRFVQLKTREGDLLDFEWSKKLLRRLIIHPAKTREVTLRLQKPLARFRLRQSRQEKGEELDPARPLELTKGTALFLDRFQKRNIF